MDQETKPVVPAWYWAVAGVALLWNLLGCAAFGMQLSAPDKMTEGMTEAQQQWRKSLPNWVLFTNGLAVCTGAMGSVALLLRNKWSVSLYAISLVSVLVHGVYTIFITGGIKILAPSQLIMQSVIVILAGALLWFSKSARGKGWLESRSNPDQAPESPA